MNSSNAVSAVVESQCRPSQRLASLDQFRGFTVAAMLLVNYFGSFKVCPQLFKHTNDYCSYADTIMPQFMFAVGFALRLSFGRRMQSEGSAAAYGRMVRRLLGLVLVSLVVYTVSPLAETWEQYRQLGFEELVAQPLKRDWFQTLMHIAVTSLWMLPVVHRTARLRIGWMVGSAFAHGVLSYWFNFAWTHTAPQAIDGGPLGFLTWCVPAMVGTLACDYFVPPRGMQAAPSLSLKPVLMAAGGLMLLGYTLSCGTRLYDVPQSQVAALANAKLAEDPVLPTLERVKHKVATAETFAWFAEPPFVRPPNHLNRKWNYWMMNQRACSLSYLTFAAGFSLMVFALFYFVCDVCKWQLSIFRTFGTNALVAYVLHSLVINAVHPFFPKDSPVWFATGGLILFGLITWLFVRQLEKQGTYLRL